MYHSFLIHSSADGHLGCFRVLATNPTAGHTHQGNQNWKRHVYPITALFITARTRKQPRCPSADEWIRKLWYIYTTEYSVQFSSVAQSCPKLFATPWITALQASLSITNSWSSLRLASIKSVMPSQTKTTHWRATFKIKTKVTLVLLSKWPWGETLIT